MSAHVVRRMITGVVLAGALVLGGGTAAQATVTQVGGGTWDYGIMNLKASMNWSHYYHGRVNHGSSVTGDQGLVRSGCVSPGFRSRAYAWDSAWWRIDRAYWRYC